MRSLALLLRVAFRSLGRNRRRTLITAIGIALGVAMCIAAAGVIEGLNADLIGAVTRVESGDVQAHAPEYLARRSLTLTMPDGARIVHDAEATSGVVAAAPRAYTWAFASKGDEAVGVQLMGIDPEREARVTTLASKLVKGAFVPATPTPWPSARPLTTEERARDAALTAEERSAVLDEIDGLGTQGGGAGEAIARVRESTKRLVRELSPPPTAPPPVVLGVKLAKKLHVDVGDRVALLGQDADGAPVDVEFTVVGVFATGTGEVDGTRALANLVDVQRYAALGTRIHELAIRTVADPAPVAKSLAGAPGFAGLEVATWSELRPDVLAMVTTNSSLMSALMGIVFFVATIGVVNTMLMAVFERKRELGVLKAVGMRPAQILTMIVIETGILGVVASIVGVGVGLGLDGYLARRGIDMSTLLGDFSLAGIGLRPVLHAAVTRDGVLVPVVTMIGMALVASLYPAIRAARVEPAVGMRDSG